MLIKRNRRKDKIIVRDHRVQPQDLQNESCLHWSNECLAVGKRVA